MSMAINHLVISLQNKNHETKNTKLLTHFCNDNYLYCLYGCEI